MSEKLLVLNMKTGDVVHDTEGHDKFVTSVAVTTDMKLIVSGSANQRVRS